MLIWPKDLQHWWQLKGFTPAWMIWCSPHSTQLHLSPRLSLLKKVIQVGLFTLLSRPFTSTPCSLVVIATVPTLLISLHPRAILTCSQLTEVGALKQIVLRVGAVRTIHLSLLWLAAWRWRELWCGVVFWRIRNCLSNKIYYSTE